MKKCKNNQRNTCLQMLCNTYNVQLLYFINHELQLKDTESAIKNKLINLLPKLRGFKFVTTLVLEFKKTTNGDETKFTTIYSNSKAEKLLLKVTLIIF